MSKKKPLCPTWGLDPEFHIFDNTKKRIVNAIPVIGHDKYDPLDLGDGFKLYSDNVLAELSLPIATNKRGVMANIMTALNRAQKSLGPRYNLVARAAVIYDPEELGPKPAKDEVVIPPAWSIGCTPNFNGYTGKANENAPFEDNMRTGSFHIHIGNPDYKEGTDDRLLTVESKHIAVRLMDTFVGCAAVIVSGDPSAKERRKLYGRAGEFRPTPYGIEYRVLENFFLRSPDLTELIFDLAAYAMWTLDEENHEDVFKKCPAKEVQKAINEEDLDLAKKLLYASPLSGDMCHRISESQLLGISTDPIRGWSLGGAS